MPDQHLDRHVAACCRHVRLGLRLRAALALTTGALSTPLLAAESPAASPVLEEIVVTAAKRSESLQDVPLSVTAISSQMIERAGIVTFLDYATKVPNLTFASGHGISDARSIALRGIQGSNTTGFYIDDMPVPTTLDPRVIDLERIEVLRGPQGSLYGARSMGGTVRLITQAPDTSAFAAKVRTIGSQVDGGGSGYQVDASVNIPIAADRAAVRLTAFGGNDPSFIERSFPNPSDPTSRKTVDVGRKNFHGGMASLLWNVTDNLTIRPMLLTERSTLNGWPLADVTASNLTQARPFDISETVEDEWTYGGVTASYATPIGDVISSTSWFSRRTFEDEDYSEQLAGILGTPLMPANFPTWQPRHSFVEELRFASRFGGPLQLVTGVFIQRSTRNYNQYSSIAGLDESVGGALGTDLVFEEWDQSKNRESAAFGELTYQLTPEWSTTLGLRYSKIKNSFDDTLGGIAAGGLTGGRGTQTESSTTPKIALKYEPTADATYYALASQGFRPGNAQTPPPPTFCGSDYAATGIDPDQISQYDSDSLWNYEVGAKTRLFDRRVTLNAAAYWIDWADLQQTVLFSCGYGYTANAGGARSRGAELELALSPMDGLTLAAGVGYTDAEITASAPLAGARKGEPVQQIAPWTAAVSADYSFPIAGEWRGILHADSSYADHSFSANNNAANPRLRRPYDISNLRFGASTDSLEIVGFVNNIGNTHANLGDNQSQAAELPGRPRILVNPPRTFGVSLTKRW
jgi:iron complex outermembrane recepter protein